VGSGARCSEGIDPVDNTISTNLANGNGVLDTKCDKSGSSNTFTGNLCGRSRPKAICVLGRSHDGRVGRLGSSGPPACRLAITNSRSESRLR
jgi:hypothetical protein